MTSSSSDGIKATNTNKMNDKNSLGVLDAFRRPSLIDGATAGASRNGFSAAFRNVLMNGSSGNSTNRGNSSSSSSTGIPGHSSSGTTSTSSAYPPFVPAPQAVFSSAASGVADLVQSSHSLSTPGVSASFHHQSPELSAQWLAAEQLARSGIPRFEHLSPGFFGGSSAAATAAAAAIAVEMGSFARLFQPPQMPFQHHHASPGLPGTSLSPYHQPASPLHASTIPPAQLINSLNFPHFVQQTAALGGFASTSGAFSGSSPSFLQGLDPSLFPAGSPIGQLPHQLRSYLTSSPHASSGSSTLPRFPAAGNLVCSAPGTLFDLQSAISSSLASTSADLGGNVFRFQQPSTSSRVHSASGGGAGGAIRFSPRICSTSTNTSSAMHRPKHEAGFGFPGTFEQKRPRLSLPAVPASPDTAGPSTAPPFNAQRPYYPSHFTKGTVIFLGRGQYKNVEALDLKDFESSANLTTNVRIDSTTVEKIEEKSADVVILSFCVGDKKTQVCVEATVEHPFYVIGQGWSSCSPERTLAVYGLACQRLQVGDVFVSLTEKDEEQQTSCSGSSQPPSSQHQSTLPYGSASPANGATTARQRPPPPLTGAGDLQRLMPPSNASARSSASTSHHSESSTMPAPELPRTIRPPPGVGTSRQGRDHRSSLSFTAPHDESMPRAHLENVIGRLAQKRPHAAAASPSSSTSLASSSTMEQQQHQLLQYQYLLRQQQDQGLQPLTQPVRPAPTHFSGGPGLPIVSSQSISPSGLQRRFTQGEAAYFPPMLPCIAGSTSNPNLQSTAAEASTATSATQDTSPVSSSTNSSTSPAPNSPRKRLGSF